MPLVSAQPTATQAAHFARLAQIAGDQVFTHLFGSRAETVLASMFRRGDNENSHRFTTFLQENGAIAGMLQGLPATEMQAQANRANWLYLRYAAWQLPRALLGVSRLAGVLEFLGSGLNDGDFYIAMLAIYPAFRGQGHSTTLLNQAAQLAANQGCARLTLDVDERNHLARAVYQRAGYKRIAQSKEVALEGERFSLLRLAKAVA